MPRLAEIEAHAASMDALLGIVGAMRSLAGIRAQEAQRALPGIRRYAAVVAEAIGTTLPFIDDGRPPAASTRGRTRALVVLAAEHGFVGGFNERLMNRLESLRRPSDLLLVMGSRGAAVAVERGLRPVWTHAMATRSAGALEAAYLLSAELFRRLGPGRLAGVEVLFGRFHRLGLWEVECKSILPLDPAVIPRRSFSQPPLLNLRPADLLEQLTGEYVFAQLMETIVESVASENAARFAAMESAIDNVRKKLGQLRQEASRVRQDEITTELLDLVVGADAVGE